MKPLRRIGLTLFMVLLGAPLAFAEDVPDQEAWIKAVRGSGSYQEGLRKVREAIDKAYDIGALKGAAHWDDIHEYFISLARAKGCERGTPHARGPVKACHQVTGKEPPITGSDYAAGVKEVSAMADDSLYADRVRLVLMSLYDYGYVQGMKHGVRVHNDDIRLRQSYYRSCMARASGTEGERACATGSKQWSEAQVNRLRKRIEAHGLPAGKAP
jgi:hypothetical protein